MITQETAIDIYNAYREIEAGKDLLVDIQKAEDEYHMDKHEPKLENAFGRRVHFEMGIPSGNNSHRIFRVRPMLAKSVIKAHIAEKEAELAEVQERAFLEMTHEKTTE